MAGKVLVLVGTKKGAFIAESDAARATWSLRGPFCEAWPINHVVGDPHTGAILAGGGNEWFGPAVWKTTDQGASWTHSSQGLAYEEGASPIKTVWSLAVRRGTVFAGVEPAGLFQSADGGVSFAEYPSLRNHPTRDAWMNSGAGGMMLHHILPHPADARRIWVGISAAGIFATDDGGESWEPRNRGTRNDYMPDKYPEVGLCVHSIALAAGSDTRMYQQNHCGMYRMDRPDGAWVRIGDNMPAAVGDIGFPVELHHADPDVAWVFPMDGTDVWPRTSPDGRPAVFCTRDAGSTWHRQDTGLPDRAWFTVKRQAMTTDREEVVGVYFGTTSGEVWASADEGQRWTRIAAHLPEIYSVECA